MRRVVQAEILDRLPPGDPRAVHSRRDLQRVNRWMRHHALMAAALQRAVKHPAPHLTDLGAGDGNFLLRVAQKLSPAWPEVQATLIDLQPNVSSETLAALAALGWRAEVVVTDIFRWPPTVGANGANGVVMANLFLHHFADASLAELLQLVSERANLFIALEPNRSGWPWFCSRLLWFIGCNHVTRHDATISVRAGFSGGELSRVWPDQQNWNLREERAGSFSHLFIAQKVT